MVSAPGVLAHEMLENPVVQPVLLVEHRIALVQWLRVQLSASGESRTSGKMRIDRNFQESIGDK